MGRVYAALCIPGALLPLWTFAPWVAAHGLNPRLLVAELFSTHVGGFFAWDVIVSAVVLVAFVLVEGGRLRMRGRWAAVAATLLVGVSLGLPLFLAMRERAQKGDAA